MRKLLIFLWLLLPVAALAYHYGPGQDRLLEDRAAEAAERGMEAARDARALQTAEGDLAAASHWAAAVEAFDEALASLPAERVVEARALRLERAKAQMLCSGLPEARRELQSLVEEMSADPLSDAARLADARGALGSAQYYTTWLMRLEGAPREEWEQEIESARQNFRLLAEEASGQDDEARAARAGEDLEAAIRLARMDLTELQGLPLPSQ
jgi:hypothetical protein